MTSFDYWERASHCLCWRYRCAWGLEHLKEYWKLETIDTTAWSGQSPFLRLGTKVASSAQTLTWYNCWSIPFKHMREHRRQQCLTGDDPPPQYQTIIGTINFHCRKHEWHQARSRSWSPKSYPVLVYKNILIPFVFKNPESKVISSLLSIIVMSVDTREQIWSHKTAK
jgi:hypothetical protein